MLFNSISFLLFFPIVVAVFFILPSVRTRNIFLLAASYFFYMNWEPVYALLLLSSTAITFFAAIGIDRVTERKRKKAFLVGSLVANLAILFFFKYYAFVAENITSLLNALGLAVEFPHFHLLLPVGISFYIFQALGYSIDVFKGKVAVERNFFTYALFVSFFPQLVAGPIERSTNLLPQFHEKKVFSYENIMSGLRLMLWGYFLKLALADRCGLYVDPVFNNVPYHNGSSFFIASLLFTFQIYGDFAGYSLTAIGAAKAMGFNLMENFRRPYLSMSVSEFWHRWHISLSSWFRDYVYIPLGGNRKGRFRSYINVLATFILSGAWHGANWTFIVWGTLHGLLLCVERFLGWNKKQWHSVSKFFHCVLTFVLVAAAWVFFRANTISDAFVIFKEIATDCGVPYMHKSNLLAVAMALTILLAKEIKDERGSKFTLSGSPSWIVRHVYIVAMIAFIFLFGVLNGDQFIYFQF